MKKDFVGSGIHSRIAHNFSKSSRNRCEKITSEPTEQDLLEGKSFFFLYILVCLWFERNNIVQNILRDCNGNRGVFDSPLSHYIVFLFAYQ